MYGILIMLLCLTTLMSGLGIFVMTLVDDKKNQKVSLVIFIVCLMIIGYLKMV
jgi:hypothetical protein